MVMGIFEKLMGFFEEKNIGFFEKIMGNFDLELDI